MEDSEQIERSFSTGQLAQFVGVPEYEVDYWAKTELLVPSIERAYGQGTRRRFSVEDVLKATFIKRLRKEKWKPNQIKTAMSVLRHALVNPDYLRDPVLVHDGRALLVLCRAKSGGRTLIDATNPSQCVLEIVLDTLEEEAKATVAQCK